MKYTFKNAMSKFNCSRKVVIHALSKYGYFSKKSIIDEKCMDYLERYFAKHGQNTVSDNKSLYYLPDFDCVKNKTVGDIMKEEFEKDCRALSEKYNYSIDYDSILNYRKKAKELVFSEGNSFKFLKAYYPDLYRVAKDCEDCYKTTRYLDNFYRYCLNDAGLFVELFVTYLIRKNGLTDICKESYGKESCKVYSKICCLRNYGLSNTIVEVLDEIRLIRNRIHVPLEMVQQDYVAGSFNFPFQQNISEYDCRKCLENIFVLGCWLVDNDDLLNSRNSN